MKALPTAQRQVTYSGMLWLLAAQLIIMLPFMAYLPWWLIPVLLFTASWRIRAMHGHTAQPGTPVKVLLILTGLGILTVSGMPFPSLNLMVTLLLLGYAFKSLEVLQQRDAVIVIFLGYFLVAVYFLYSSSITAGLYGILALIIQTAALMGVQHPIASFSTQRSIRHNLYLSTLLLLQCLPLMLLIFVFAPRLPPLFNMSLSTDQAKTGIADYMAPGDIARLSQSDELAFRVTFKGQRPSQNALYWRGLTLNHFDGRRWQQFADDYGFHQLKSDFKSIYRWQPDNVKISGPAIEYEAIYEKTGQPWLFTLTPSPEVYGDVIRGADYRVMATRELQSPTLLRAVSYPESQRDLKLEPLIRQLSLQLPGRTDPRTRQLAAELRAQAANDQDYINRVLQRFRQQNFYYTLRPPTLGDTDTIDRFLFDSQRGFCAHYAGSFVFMMRAAGIPARVVAGYQGGEWNENGQYLLVHQFDAHAWTEVWLAGQGWVRIDPTTMVAPERTEQSLEAAMQTEGSFLESQLFSTRRIAWLNQWRRKLDAVQYNWRRWVLGYDNQSQTELLKKLFGELDWQKSLTLLGALLAALSLFWILVMGLHRSTDKLPPEQRLYRKFCRRLEKRGVTRAHYQTPGEFAQQAALSLPQQALVIREFSALYEQICYVPADGAGSSKKALLAQLGKKLSEL